MASEEEKEIEALPSLKDLASSDPSLRRKALQTIISHLEERDPSHSLTKTQALQLWRAFHVALYMHDSKNQLSVQTLIATLAGTFKIMRKKDLPLLLKTKKDFEANGWKVKVCEKSAADDEEFEGFDDDDVDKVKDVKPRPTLLLPYSTVDCWLSTYCSAFWETMAREWSGIDQWRMNKYLLLIRFALREMFKIYLKSWFNVEKEDEYYDQRPKEAKEAEGTAGLSTVDDGHPQPNSPVTTRSGKRKNAETTREESTTVKSKKSKSEQTAKTVPNGTHNKSTAEESEEQNTDANSSQKEPSKELTENQLHHLTHHLFSPLSILPGSSVTDGLRLHMLDIYTEELFRAASELNLQRTFSDYTLLVNGKDQRAADSFIAISFIDTFTQPLQLVSKASGGPENGKVSKHVRVKAKECLKEFQPYLMEFLDEV